MLTVLKWLGAGIVAGLSLLVAWKTDWMSGDMAAIATAVSLPVLFGLKLWMYYEEARGIRDRDSSGNFQRPPVEHKLDDDGKRHHIEGR